MPAVTNMKTNHAAYSLNEAKLVLGGQEYFDLLEKLIRSARYYIHLQVYIFEEDETGTHIADMLVQAALKGVSVYLLVDGYASQNLSRSFVSKLEDADVHFAWFEPLFKSSRFYFGRRLHYKVLVVDGIEAMVGGINISERYKGNDHLVPWFDMALYVKGPVAAELNAVCCKTWNSYSPQLCKLPEVKDAPVLNTQVQELTSVRVRMNDWVKRKSQVWRTYADMFVNAQNSIVIVCSYFLPGWKFRKLMAAAVKRGVSIKIVVAGPSDVMIAKHAERFLYRWVLQNNIRLFEYQKSVLHAKVATSDGKRMTIGSYNVNNISEYASIELNLDVRGKPFVTDVDAMLEKMIATDCLEITMENYLATTSRIRQLWQHLCYEVIKVVLYLFTFYFKKDKPFNNP